MNITIDNNLTDTIILFRQLQRKNPNYANLALSKSGAKLYNAIKENALKQGSHKWGKECVTDKKGKKHIHLTYGQPKKYYSRHTLKNCAYESDDPYNFGEFARFRVYPKTNIGLIGFFNTKSFQAYKFDDGKMKPFKRQSGVKVKKIAEKLEKGGRRGLSRNQQKVFMASGFGRITSVRYKAHHLIRKTFRQKRQTVIDVFSRVYLEAIEREVEKV